MGRGKLSRDFSEARRRMRYPTPIAPIDEQFAHSGGMYQGAAGWLNIRSFLQSYRQVRGERHGARR
ncbi:MAG TPA: hypothetical protein VGO03_07590 [Acidimicrobiia bacterium]